MMLTACQTRVVSIQKPMQNNSFELYQKYTVQMNDAKVIKLEVLKEQDFSDRIRGVTGRIDVFVVNPG